MKPFYICILLLLSFGAEPFSHLGAGRREGNNTSNASATSNYLYTRLELAPVVSYAAFDRAMRGYDKLEAKKKKLLVVIDFSKPSTEERMCVVDIEDGKLLHTSHVAHGRNSGENYATSFSNKPGSHQSSLGFYVTENTYQGKNGYSLILEGLEKGINDKAKERAIVIHGASYCDPSVIKSAGRLGRSFGCPALPSDKSKEIIDTIKEGVIIYIYANDEDYLSQSEML